MLHNESIDESKPLTMYSILHIHGKLNLLKYYTKEPTKPLFINSQNVNINTKMLWRLESM